MQLSVPRSLSRDERGNTIVQFVLVLPIFVILVYGSYEIWKLVHLKQTLEAATIQATRYLSMEGPYLDQYPADWQARARFIVANELTNEPLLKDELDSIQLWVDVGTRSGLGAPSCPGEDSMRAREAVNRAERAEFFVSSRADMPSPLRIPLVGTAENLSLTETHWHYLECDPNSPPTPEPD